jgi:Zn-dependent metalloprotease
MNLSFLMKTKWPITLIALLLLGSCTSMGQAQNKTDAKKAAQQKAKRTHDSILTERSSDSLPSYTINESDGLIEIKFFEASKVNIDNFFPFFYDALGKNTNGEFKFISTNTEEGSIFKHHRYDQFYKGIPVNGGQMTLHQRGGRLYLALGKYYRGLELSATPGLSKEAAIAAALTYVGATQYSWQNTELEKSLKEERGDPFATYYPTTTLVIAPKNHVYETANFRLCYKIFVYALDPFQKLDIYVDAQTGEIISTETQILS